MRKLFLATIVVLSGSMILRAADPLKEADAAFGKKDFAKAAELATAAVRADPKNTSAHYLLGMSRIKLRDNAAAVEAFTAALVPATGTTGPNRTFGRLQSKLY